MTGITLALQDIQNFLPPRRSDVHKGSLGKVLILAGSRGMSGAAILASRAVMRSGAGLATLFTPASLANLIDVQNPEVMTYALPETIYGSISKSSLEHIISTLKNFDTVLIGPGLSGNKNTLGLIRDILEYIRHEQPKIKLVIDADGLKALKKMTRPFSQPVIITPHFGELALLLDRSISEIREKPDFFARKYAAEKQVIVILKSHLTYIVKPDSNKFFITNNGNPGMATAGSGDVLAGLTAGLWASTKISAIKAAAAAPFIHAVAGNIAAAKKSIDGIIASDILEEIPAALKYIKGA